jgi:hypothetical protein
LLIEPACTGTGAVDRGEVNISIDNLDRLSAALGVELAELLMRR